MPVPSETLELPTDTTPVRRAAEIYADLGFKVIPLYGVLDGKCTCHNPECDKSTGKHPLSNQWQKQASSDADVVRELFRAHTGNIGVMLGNDFVVIDIDGARGFELVQQLGDMPITLTSRSGSGGEHRVFRYAKHQDPNEVTNRRIVGDTTGGVDVKTRTGQIVVAPSMHRSGERYQWTTCVQPATLPDALYEQIRKPKAPVIPITRATASNTDLYTRAKAYLATVPPAISGSGGHTQTFAAARSLAGFINKGLPESEAWDLLQQYNQTCQPPWALHELQHKLNEAKKATTIPALEDRPKPSPAVSINAPRPGTRPTIHVADPALPPEPTWQQRIVWEQNKQGTSKARKHLENAIVILRYHPAWRGRLRLDTHSLNVVAFDAPWHESDRPQNASGEQIWTDADTIRLSAWILRENALDLSVEACDRAVIVAAESNKYHPIKDYFNSLVWDQTPRLATAAARYLGAEQSEYTALVIRWWMIAAVARTFQPGCKADNVLILEGEQGIKKSSALRTLAGVQWFSDTPIDLHSKDAYQALPGKLIVELAELESLRKADAARAKSFFTSSVDDYRPPYGRRNIKVPRGCVFAGTVNHASYLQDSTGNRRYWPVACRAVDLDGIADDRDQLWAEAVYWYQQEAKWWPDTAEEQAVCTVEQDPRAEGDAWEQVVETYISRRIGPTVYVTDVLENALKIPTGQWDRGSQMRVASVLQRLGYRRYREAKGKRLWFYSLTTPANEDAEVRTEQI